MNENRCILHQLSSTEPKTLTLGWLYCQPAIEVCLLSETLEIRRESEERERYNAFMEK